MDFFNDAPVNPYIKIKNEHSIYLANKYPEEHMFKFMPDLQKKHYKKWSENKKYALQFFRYGADHWKCAKYYAQQCKLLSEKCKFWERFYIYKNKSEMAPYFEDFNVHVNTVNVYFDFYLARGTQLCQYTENLIRMKAVRKHLEKAEEILRTAGLSTGEIPHDIEVYTTAIYRVEHFIIPKLREEYNKVHHDLLDKY